MFAGIAIQAQNPTIENQKLKKVYDNLLSASTIQGSMTSSEVKITPHNPVPISHYKGFIQKANQNHTGAFNAIHMQELNETLYYEGFESESFPPEGWRLEKNSGNDWTAIQDASMAYAGERAINYKMHLNENADSWIFSKGINLEAGKTYEVSFYQKVLTIGSIYKEKLKLTVGTENTIAGQTMTLWDNDTLTNEAYEKRSAYFTPETTGTYYFGLQAYSDSDQYDILVKEQVIFAPIAQKPGDYWYSSMAWADYDKDGDADLLISGAYPREGAPYDAGASTTHIYNNDGQGNLTLNTEISLQGVHASDVKWLDYDNDGDLDIMMMGIDYETAFNMSAIYNNDNGVFTAVEVGTNGASWGSLSVGDYDNDGDLDVLMAGWNVGDAQNNYASTYIWKNEGGTLTRTDITPIVPSVFDGKMEWVDIDNDNDLDIIASPPYGADAAKLRVYKRENNTYTLKQKIDHIKSYKIFATGDYNNDGYIDIAVQTTDDNYNNFVEILMNNQGTFEYVSTLPSVSSSGASKPLAWGDFDNDGDLDLLVAGLNSDYNGVSILYENKDGVFEAVQGTGFDAVGGHSLSWQDIDGDLDLDVLITGFIQDDTINEFYGTSRLYKNTIENKNTAPTPPQELSSEVNNGVITFSWSGATDEQTPEAGLSYHLQLGTTSGGYDVANYQVTGTSWKLENLPNTAPLYWCVKSIDTSFVMSECSEEQMTSHLSTVEVALDKNIVEVISNPVEYGVIHLSTAAWEHTEMQVQLLDMQGRLIFNKTYKNVKDIVEVPVHHIPSGKYFLQYHHAKDKGTLAIIIKQ